MFNKIILISLFFITVIFSTTNSIWNTNNKLVYSENELIIMLSSDIAPKLGIETPLDINSYSNLDNSIKRFGKLIDFKPVFIMYEKFTEQERLSKLHQFYIVTHPGQRTRLSNSNEFLMKTNHFHEK